MKGSKPLHYTARTIIPCNRYINDTKNFEGVRGSEQKSLMFC